MLTRLEADGFKNLLDFSVQFGPYTCIAGPNAVGKSNVFDVIEFLSLIADKSFMEAAQELRSAGQRSADPRSLFWRSKDGAASDMTLAAEMIVPEEVEDDFGRVARPTMTFLRYEVSLRYVPPDKATGARFGRILLMKESLRHINKGDAARHLPWKHSAGRFRDAVVKGRRYGAPYISTRTEVGGTVVVEVHQDGGSRGKARPSPADRAPRTIVATTTTADDPTILAARREMQNWRKLSLEPTAMRAPDSLTDPSEIGTDGSHLAAALYRLAGDEPASTYAAVSSAASDLVDVRQVEVAIDHQRETLTLQARVGSGPLLPARSLSDGTLRFLALCILQRDVTFDGVVCMEEPENGIHPAKIQAMVRLLRSMAVNPQEAPGPGNAMRQVIVNTHSPYFVVLQDDDELLVATPVTVRRGDEVVRTMRLLPRRGTWRAIGDGFAGSRASIVDYLQFPENAKQQPMLDWEDEEREVVLPR